MYEPRAECHYSGHEIKKGVCIYCGGNDYETVTYTGEGCNDTPDGISKGNDYDADNLVVPRDDVRGYNIGSSNYSEHKIQPWDIIEEYSLDYWDGDIIKRVLRNKPNEMELDYEKIIHICKKQIERIDNGTKQN